MILAGSRFLVIKEKRIWKSQGVTRHVNQQGGQWLKKIITPKKYLNSAKNTRCGKMGLTQNGSRDGLHQLQRAKPQKLQDKKYVNSCKNTWNI